LKVTDFKPRIFTKNRSRKRQRAGQFMPVCTSTLKANNTARWRLRLLLG